MIVKIELKMLSSYSFFLVCVSIVVLNKSGFVDFAVQWLIHCGLEVQIMFSSILHKRLPAESGISVVCNTPGIVLTNVVSSW